MKTARAGHQLAHLHRKFEYQTKDYIYATGSKYPDQKSKKCEVYDVAANKWTEIGDLNSSRHNHSLCVLESRYIYCLPEGTRSTRARLRPSSASMASSTSSNKNGSWSKLSKPIHFGQHVTQLVRSLCRIRKLLSSAATMAGSVTLSATTQRRAISSG